LEPTSPEPFRRALAAYLADPSEDRWNELYTKLIPGSRGRTVWQAWIAIDGAAPSCLSHFDEATGERWPRIPDAFTVRRAVRAALRGDVPVSLGALLDTQARAPRVPR